MAITVNNISLYKSTYYPGDAISGDVSITATTETVTKVKFTARVGSDLDLADTEYTIENNILPTYFSSEISKNIATTLPNLTFPSTINIVVWVFYNNDLSMQQITVNTSAIISDSPPLLDIQSHGVGFMTSANTSGPCSLNIGGDKFINFYPIGSLYFSIYDTNPSTYFGGTWELFGPGRTIKGVSYTQTVGEVEPEITSGEKTHQLTINEMPAHTHEYRMDSKLKSGSNYNRIYSYGLGGSGAQAGYTTSSTGGDQPHNNMQPYITCYIWKRTG